MSLTGHLDDPQSALRRFFSDTYPHIDQVRFAAVDVPRSTITISGEDLALTTQSRFSPGGPKVLPPADQSSERAYDRRAAGTAFDYRVRFLLAPQDPARLTAAAGARHLARRWHQPLPGPGWNELAQAILSLQATDGTQRLSDSTSLTTARLCGLLALYEQLYRCPERYATNNPLVLAGPDADLQRQFRLVDERLVHDVVALTALFEASQPALANPRHQVVCNPTFDCSSDLGGADADLIVDGTLIEIKTVTTAVLNSITIWQVLGYLLADTTDRHSIRTVGWYFSRHGYLWRLPAEEFLGRLKGGPVDLATARAEFSDLLAPADSRVTTSEQTWDSWVNPRIQQTMSFYPTSSGRGRWHIPSADVNASVGSSGGHELATGAITPVCGSRAMLYPGAAPARPTVGQLWRDDDRLCRTCLRHTQADHDEQSDDPGEAAPPR